MTVQIHVWKGTEAIHNVSQLKLTNGGIAFLTQHGWWHYEDREIRGIEV